MEKITFKEQCDIRKNVFHTGHMLLAGMPGSGKTTSVLKEIESIKKETADNIIFITNTTAEKIEGFDKVELYKNENYINPLDIYLFNLDNRCSKDETYLCFLKEETMRQVEEIVLLYYKKCNGLEHVSVYEETILQRVCFDVFDKFINTLIEKDEKCNIKDNPTFEDIYKKLVASQEENSKYMSIERIENLWNTIKESDLYHKTTIAISPYLQIVITDDNKHPFLLSQIAIFEYVRKVSQFLYNRNNERTTWVFFDDADLFAGDENVSDFLADVLKRNRYYREIVTIVLNDNIFESVYEFYRNVINHIDGFQFTPMRKEYYENFRRLNTAFKDEVLNIDMNPYQLYFLSFYEKESGPFWVE